MRNIVAGINVKFKYTIEMFEKSIGYLAICGLAGWYITNVLLYYLGVHGTNYRMALLTLISVIIFCLACIRFLQIYLIRVNIRKPMNLVLIIPLCGLLIFGGAYLKFGASAKSTVEYLLQFGCFCIPSFIFGLDCALNRQENKLFMSLDLLSLFYIPFAILCIYYMFNSPGRLMTLGEFDYMGIAYTLLLPLAFLIVSVVLLPNRSFLSYKTDEEYLRNRLSIIICFGIAIMFWFIIMATGTRGTMLCVFGFNIFLMIWTAFIKDKKLFIRALLTFLLFTLLFILFMYVIKSEYAKDAASRMNYFISNLMDGKFKTSTTVAVSKTDLDSIISISNPSESTNAKANTKPVNTEPVNTEPINKNTESIKKNIDPTNIVMNREQIYYAALREFLNSPVMGMGPMGFHIKYGRYAHNIVLEVLCDYGIIGALIFFGTILFFVIRLVELAKMNAVLSAILTLLLCMNLPLLFGGTFIRWPPFWFFIGYCSLYKKWVSEPMSD